METQNFDVGNLVEEVLMQKKAEGRDYYFVQKTKKETYYLDDDDNVLVHHGRKEQGIVYLLELEETKGKNESCSFSVYMRNGSESSKKILGIFDSEGSNENKAQAAQTFRRFRDAGDIKMELEKYSKEKL